MASSHWVRRETGVPPIVERRSHTKGLLLKGKSISIDLPFLIVIEPSTLFCRDFCFQTVLNQGKYLANGNN
jgi:hypothetical protein